MWRILNFIFGWDYVLWTTRYNYGISRVFVDHACNAYCFMKYNHPSFGREKGVAKIDGANKFIWLTCHHTKYLKPERK